MPMRAPLSLGERVRVLAGLARQAIWARQQFVKELFAAALTLLTGIGGGS